MRGKYFNYLLRERIGWTIEQGFNKKPKENAPKLIWQLPESSGVDSNKSTKETIKEINMKFEKEGHIAYRKAKCLISFEFLGF